MAKTSAKLTGERCRCPACFEVFSTVSNFDKHRKGVYADGRYCVSPESVGLVIRETASGTFWKGAPPVSGVDYADGKWL